MKIFETHAHYEDEAFDNDREELLQEIHDNDVEIIVNIGTNVALSEESIELAKTYDFIYAAVGIHPEYPEEGLIGENIEKIEKMLDYEKTVAIGEIGLDYHYENTDEIKKMQKETFRAQLDLAVKYGFPIVVHSRDATQDTLDIIKEYYGKNSHNKLACPGVIHCFSASEEIAKEYVKMGFMIGIGGACTWKKANRLKRVIENTPLQNIILETDCPYQTPEPHRGKRNSSLYLHFVCEKIAEILGLDPEEVAKVTFENSMRMYSKIGE
ncbi:MAG: TatD family hydrolase [Lachnospiraceae bacterium]|nr:TatD family hydrolase [Lachnospiraceae bacterium]